MTFLERKDSGVKLSDPGEKWQNGMLRNTRKTPLETAYFCPFSTILIVANILNETWYIDN